MANLTCYVTNRFGKRSNTLLYFKNNNKNSAPVLDKSFKRAATKLNYSCGWILKVLKVTSLMNKYYKAQADCQKIIYITKSKVVIIE